MLRRITALCAVAVLGLFGAMMLTSPAQAQDGYENPPNVTVTSYDCKVKLIFNNTGPYTDGIGHAGPWFMEFDYRVEGDPQLELETDLVGLSISDPPLAPQAFDGLHNPVPVPAGTSKTEYVNVDPGTDKLEYRLVRGAEQRVFFDWVKVEINCPAPDPEPTPTVEPTSSPSPTASPAPGQRTCDEFETQEQAQKAFEAGATELDGNNDGVACQDLPSGGQAGGDDTDKPGLSGLPVTGSPLAILTSIGLVLLTAGGGAMLLSRLRRSIT